MSTARKKRKVSPASARRTRQVFLTIAGIVFALLLILYLVFVLA